MTIRLSIVLCIAGLLGQACSVVYEDGQVTTAETSVSATCGNGVVEIGERCDDGNIAGNDACAADCQRKLVLCADAWVAEGTACVVPPRCGDGNLDSGEECDDGNREDGDGCPANCVFPPDPRCGDGTVDPGEVCDDSNNANGDYCAGNCHFVTGRCGDFVIQGNEACDDGNVDDGDYCAADCQSVTGRCGDGVVQTGEACDDANRLNDDYCAADCRTVTGRCGDGIKQPNEGCDDGNTRDGDLCPSSCAALDLSACADAWDPAFCPTPINRFLSYSATPDGRTTCMVTLDGTSYCKGSSTYGECGTGQAVVTETGRAVSTQYPFRQISAAVFGFVSCAVAADNSLWCWGSDLKKGLGRGLSQAPETCHIAGLGTSSGYIDNTPCSTIPIRVGSRVDWKKVVTAGELVCALSLGGELWCWGEHRAEPSASPDNLFLAAPTRIAPGTTWSDVQISRAVVASNVQVHTIYAVDTDGKLWRWASHYPTTAYPLRRLTDDPELVTGLSGKVVSVSVDYETAIAATTTGTYRLVVQGLAASAPQLIATSPLFVAVAAGRIRYNVAVSACGLTSEGKVYCWGANTAGQLADGTTSDRTLPVLAHSGETFGRFGENGPFCVAKASGETRCFDGRQYSVMRKP